MEDESNKNLIDLPNDWWQYASAFKALSDWFIRHLLALFLSYEFEGQTHHRFWTGFLLYYRELLWWVTAGHVIEDLCKVLSNSSISVLRMRWADGCEIPGAESIPVHNRDLKMFSTFKSGIDFGVVNIAGLDAANILNGGRVEILTEQVWKNLNLAQPEGFWVLGFPQEWVEHEEDCLSDNRILHSVRANLACLPVSRVEYRGNHRTKKFWDDPQAFYGQILPFVDNPDYQPKDIGGMSGGPLISIERDPDGGIRYRLFGILRSWDESDRLIRAEPIQRIVEVIRE